ncbi:MAG: phosphoribosylformylglycinamidine synthase subunit PurS [Cuniculiplasma sp.]
MVKIRLEISYLPGVEDPEATTLHHNLGILGYYSIESVSMLKVYEMEFSEDEETAKSMAKIVAESILINPVINSYKLIVLGE